MSTGSSTALASASTNPATAVLAAATTSSGVPRVSPAQATSTGPAAAAGARVSLDQFDPISSPRSPLGLGGRVEVPGSLAVTALTVRVSLGAPVTSRSTLDRLRADPASIRYPTVAASQTINDPAGPFSINQDLTRLRLRSSLTVYPVKIAAYGAPPGRSASELGATYTFLVWSPPVSTAAASTTAVATILPLADQPRLRSDGILTDNTIASEIRPGGRLSRLLDAVAPGSGMASPVALALDPTLLRTLQIMESGYQVASTPNAVSWPPSADASTFLHSLRTFAATSGNTVIALPWGDADLAAMVHAGRLDDARYAVTTGREMITSVLGAGRPQAMVAYPADGLADAATIQFLASLGMSTVIVNDRLLPATGRSVATPSAISPQVTAAGSIRALAADSGLESVVTSVTGTGSTPPVGPASTSPAAGTGSGSGAGAGAGGAGAGAAAASQPAALSAFIAELAMISAQQPPRSRLAVLALPRLWDPPGDWARRVVTALTAQSGPASSGPGPLYAPFVQAVALSHDDGTSAAAAAAARGPLVYPDWARAAEIPTTYLDAVEALRGEAGILAPVLCSQVTPTGVTPTADQAACRARVIKPMTDTLLAAMSVDWRVDRSGAVRLSQEVDGLINEIRGGIKVVASPKVTLTSSHGKVPLTLENNNLDRQITVTLSLSSNDRTRLRSAARETRTVEAGGKEQVEIEVNADAAGTFPVYVDILTPDGQRLSTQPTRILVRSTAYGTIATAITIGAVGVLLLAVLFRLVRRIRSAGRPDPADAALAGAATPAGEPGPDGGVSPDGGLDPPAEQTLPLGAVRDAGPGARWDARTADHRNLPPELSGPGPPQSRPDQPGPAYADWMPLRPSDDDGRRKPALDSAEGRPDAGLGPAGPTTPDQRPRWRSDR